MRHELKTMAIVILKKGENTKQMHRRWFEYESLIRESLQS